MNLQGKSQSMDDASHRLMTYAGLLMFAFGLIGNLFNIGVFTRWTRSPDRRSNSPLYLLVASVANLFLIVYPLTTRILFDGYQYPVTLANVFLLCQLRFFVLHSAGQISLACLCLATIDRYLISSPEARLRRLSPTRKATVWISSLLVALICAHSLPVLIYYTTSTAGQCLIASTRYLVYYRYAHQIFLHGLIPVFVFSLFGLLTYQQLKRLPRPKAHRGNLHVDKQLSRMLLLMSLTVVLSSIPYSIESIYYIIFTERSEQQTSFILLFHILSSLFFYANAVCSFYVFFISTPNFRSELKKILRCGKIDLPALRSNQVNSISRPHNGQLHTERAM